MIKNYGDPGLMNLSPPSDFEDLGQIINDQRFVELAMNYG